MSSMDRLEKEAKRWYDFNASSRYYHNWSHAQKVMAALPIKPSESLYIAAMWHDAVYIPGAPNDSNEQSSASALQFVCGSCGFDKKSDVIIEAKTLILGTSLSWHLLKEDDCSCLSLDHAYLLDADLSSLADPYEDFHLNQCSILMENGLAPNKENLKNSAKFLKNFLHVRSNIYHTLSGRERWEHKARRNILTFVGEILDDKGEEK